MTEEVNGKTAAQSASGDTTDAASSRVYRLKYMVAARICAEASAFFFMLALPLVLLLLGKFFDLSWTYKLIVSVLGLIGLLVLPVYGFITYKVTVIGDELTAHSLFRKHACLVSTITKISRRCNFNWIRYVVQYEGGELTFPIWLKDVDGLVDYLRKEMPTGAGERLAALINRKFRQDPVSLIFQVAQAVAGMIFTGVVWFFAASLYQSGSAGISAADEILVAVFAVAISGILLWRTVVVALMPKIIEVREDDVVLQTFFFEKKVRWLEVKPTSEPFPLLPEGFMFNSKHGNFLVGNGMDAADELAEAINQRMAKAQS
jgi:hypothetical protein